MEATIQSFWQLTPASPIGGGLTVAKSSWLACVAQPTPVNQGPKPVVACTVKKGGVISKGIMAEHFIEQCFTS